MKTIQQIIPKLKTTEFLLKFFIFEFQLDSLVKIKKGANNTEQTEQEKQEQNQIAQNWIEHVDFLVVQKNKNEDGNKKYYPLYTIYFKNRELELKEPQFTAEFLKTLEVVSKIKMLSKDLKLSSFAYNLEINNNPLIKEAFYKTMPIINYWHIIKYVLPWSQTRSLFEGILLNYTYYLTGMLKSFYQINQQKEDEINEIREILKYFNIPLVIFFDTEKIFDNPKFVDYLKILNIYENLRELTVKFLKDYAKEIKLYKIYFQQPTQFSSIQDFLYKNNLAKEIKFKVVNQKLMCYIF